ncbi:hypothetical protein ES708_02356 [subsurface metagenome]
MYFGVNDTSCTTLATIHPPNTLFAISAYKGMARAEIVAYTALFNAGGMILSKREVVPSIR